MTRLLVLGGTEFVGLAVVREALARGWQVTTFNRGTRRDVEGVFTRVGDRTAVDGLAALTGGEWDVVVDTWSQHPSAVRDAARTLADRVGCYAYISSRSVYAFPTPAGADESAPLVDGVDPDAGPDDAVDYAQAKAGGEAAVVAAFDDRSLLIRPGLILGPDENVGRLPWWLDRVARAGRVLAPGPPDLPLQLVDVRDLASFTLDAALAGRRGAFDVVSRSGHATMRSLLDACVAVAGEPTTELVWVPPEPILAAGVQPWNELPVWIPPGELHDALHRSSVSKAVAAGLSCRPVEDTVTDTWAWLCSGERPPRLRTDRPPVGLDGEVEAQLLTGA